MLCTLNSARLLFCFVLFLFLVTVSYNILIGKLRKYGVNEWTVRWIENWLTGKAQRAVIRGIESVWKPEASHVS